VISNEKSRNTKKINEIPAVESSLENHEVKKISGTIVEVKAGSRLQEQE
jgi:hypothetical protein